MTNMLDSSQMVFTLGAFLFVKATYCTVFKSGNLMSEDTVVDFAKSRAAIEAERNILDQVCVYVKAQSSTIDNELDNDEVISIGAGILYVTDTKYQMLDDAQGILVKATVTAQIDIDELETLLKQAIAERQH